MSTSKAWDVNKINGFFDSITSSRILKTPLFASVSDDAIAWKLEHDGEYSVRSAYKYCMNTAGTHNSLGITGSWQLIWRMKTPPKVKNLLWRICRNVLPTRSRLNSRGINCPVNCAGCNDAAEDSIHVLFLCPRSVQCWQQARLWDQVSAGFNNNNNIIENIFSILHRLDKAQQEFFSVLVWSIWKCRNNKVWENVTDTAQTVCERARHLITSWRSAQNFQSHANITQPASQQTRWSKPSIGRYKCNIDASFSHTDNKVGIGICIRDDNGRFVSARTEWIEPILDVEVGEAMGLLSALRWVDELQLRNMDFEMDCKRVVDGLNSSRTQTSDLGAILSDCRLILATSFVNSHVKFIRRQANEVAHTLARVSTSLASFHNFIDIPTCIYDIIINEMR
jgi:ribonuclease HI